MSDSHRVSGPQFRADRAEEQEAVRTTIVGGRPPGSGQRVGPIPRGLEVLVKKAAVDPEFRALLLARRAEAAGEIHLKLDPAETMMLAAAPAAQLEAIIDQTVVPQEHRRTFLGKAAAAMLAALGLSQAACGPVAPAGERPDPPQDRRRHGEDPATTTGIAPDMPPEKPPAPGERPDMPSEHPAPAEDPPAAASEPEPPDPLTRGIRPD